MNVAAVSRAVVVTPTGYNMAMTSTTTTTTAIGPATIHHAFGHLFVELLPWIGAGAVVAVCLAYVNGRLSRRRS